MGKEGRKPDLQPPYESGEDSDDYLTLTNRWCAESVGATDSESETKSHIAECALNQRHAKRLTNAAHIYREFSGAIKRMRDDLIAPGLLTAGSNLISGEQCCKIGRGLLGAVAFTYQEDIETRIRRLRITMAAILFFPRRFVDFKQLGKLGFFNGFDNVNDYHDFFDSKLEPGFLRDEDMMFENLEAIPGIVLQRETDFCRKTTERDFIAQPYLGNPRSVAEGVASCPSWCHSKEKFLFWKRVVGNDNWLEACITRFIHDYVMHKKLVGIAGAVDTIDLETKLERMIQAERPTTDFVDKLKSVLYCVDGKLYSPFERRNLTPPDEMGFCGSSGCPYVFAVRKIYRRVYPLPGDRKNPCDKNISGRPLAFCTWRSNDLLTRYDRPRVLQELCAVHNLDAAAEIAKMIDELEEGEENDDDWPSRYSGRSWGSDESDVSYDSDMSLDSGEDADSSQTDSDCEPDTSPPIKRRRP